VEENRNDLMLALDPGSAAMQDSMKGMAKRNDQTYAIDQCARHPTEAIR
jgi:hypothetical protein